MTNVHPFEYVVAAADAAFENGDYPGARDKYVAAIEAEPTHSNALYAAVRVEICEDLIGLKTWFGDEPPELLPTALLASVSLDGHHPEIRRALFGRAAYDCFHLDTYLTDLLRRRRFPGMIQADFLLLHLCARVLGEGGEFLELGGSLYAAFEKLSSAQAHAERHGVAAPAPAVAHVCVEMSDRLRYVAHHLHFGDDIRFYSTWQDVPPPLLPRLTYSNSVGNYAFSSTEDYVNWLAQSNVALLCDKFTRGGDHLHQMMGKRFVSFDIDAIIAALESHGFKAFLIGMKECSPFLNDVVEEKRIFFDGMLFVHRFETVDLERLADMLDCCGAQDIPSFWNTQFEPDLSRNSILAPTSIDAMVSAKEWCRNYRLEFGSGSKKAGNFDFSMSGLPERLNAYVGTLENAYGVIPGKRLAGVSSMSAVRNVFAKTRRAISRLFHQ